MDRELIRAGAVDALGAARGDHLGKLFRVVMPDGRVRTDWEYAMWEQVCVCVCAPVRVHGIYSDMHEIWEHYVTIA